MPRGAGKGTRLPFIAPALPWDDRAVSTAKVLLVSVRRTTSVGVRNTYNASFVPVGRPVAVFLRSTEYTI